MLFLQRQILIEKLEGYKAEHQGEEDEISEEISIQKHLIAEVTDAYKARLKLLKIFDENEAPVSDSPISQ